MGQVANDLAISKTEELLPLLLYYLILSKQRVFSQFSSFVQNDLFFYLLSTYVLSNECGTNLVTYGLDETPDTYLSITNLVDNFRTKLGTYILDD